MKNLAICVDKKYNNKQYSGRYNYEKNNIDIMRGGSFAFGVFSKQRVV